MMLQPISSEETQALSLGTIAAQRLQAADSWTVLASYPQCLYCSDAQGNLVCIGKEKIGSGPLNLLLPEAASPLLHRISMLHTFTVNDQYLLFDDGRCRIIVTSAEIRDYPLDGIDRTRETLTADLLWLTRQAEEYAPAESFGAILPELLPGLRTLKRAGYGSALSRLLHNRILQTAAATRRGLCCDGQPTVAEIFRHCRSLIGLGNGLTPAGDDFLAGMIMGLAKTGRLATALAFAAKVSKEAEGKTTQVSLSFYQAIAQGQICQAHSLFLDALGNGLSTTRRHLLTEVTQYGATSGWDTVAGICFGISLEAIPAPATQHISGESVC